MPIDNLAKWTILPNWRQPVVERLSWLSAVLTSDSGAEQRFGLRWSPRRSFEPIFTVTGRARALLDVSLAAAGAAEWYVPVWHDGNVLTAPLGLGAASIPTDTAFREFKVGGYVMLWQDEFTAEVHEVTSVGSGTVGIDPVTSREWPIGSRVFPCVRARIGDIPELARKSGNIFEGGIRFDISTDNDWSDVAATIDLPTYLSYRVLTQRPNRREDLSLRYERMIEDLDADVGLTLRRDVSGLAFPVQSHSWLRLGREEQAKLRALLYDLSGRVTPLWVPTFDDDLLLADDVDAADTTLLIHKAGLDAFGVPFSGREHICIRLRDGTDIFRQITSVVASGDTETVTLSAAVGQTFTRRAVHSVSFMSLCRQNADEVEFNHITDGGNATEVTVSFRHAPDIRSATDIGTPYIGNTTMGSEPCGIGYTTWRFTPLGGDGLSSTNNVVRHLVFREAPGGDNMLQLAGATSSVPSNNLWNQTRHNELAGGTGSQSVGTWGSHPTTGPYIDLIFPRKISVRHVEVLSGSDASRWRGSPACWALSALDDATGEWHCYKIGTGIPFTSMERRFFDVPEYPLPRGLAGVQTFMWMNKAGDGKRIKLEKLTYAMSSLGPQIAVGGFATATSTDIPVGGRSANGFTDAGFWDSSTTFSPGRPGLLYTFAGPTLPTHYRLRPRYTLDVKDWDIWCLVNGVEWKLLHSVRDEPPFLTTTEERSYPLSY